MLALPMENLQGLTALPLDVIEQLALLPIDQLHHLLALPIDRLEHLVALPKQKVSWLAELPTATIQQGATAVLEHTWASGPLCLEWADANPGVLVAELSESNTPAGLAVGMLVVAINGERVAGEAFAEVLDKLSVDVRPLTIRFEANRGRATDQKPAWYNVRSRITQDIPQGRVQGQGAHQG